MMRVSRMWRQGGCVTRVFMLLVISGGLLFCLAIVAALVAPPSDEATPTSPATEAVRTQDTPTVTATASRTPDPTATFTPSPTITSTPTLTPSPVPTRRPTVPPPTPVPADPFGCNNIDDLNCSDFRQLGINANAHLAQCGDEDRLDAEGDGRACE